MSDIAKAQEAFGELIQSEFERIQRMKADQEVKDFSSLDKIIVGILPGDGIGPIIMEQALRVIRALIPEEIESGRVELRMIQGMTIENRAAGMLLAHIGFADRKAVLEQAMDICTITERKVVLTTLTQDASTKEFTDYIIDTINRIR